MAFGSKDPVVGPSRVEIFASVPAAAGVATWIRHVDAPVGHGNSVRSALQSAWADPAFAILAGVTLVVLLAGWSLAPRLARRPADWRGPAALCVGLSAPLLSPFLDPWSFRCPATGLALLGAALGVVAGVQRREGTADGGGGGLDRGGRGALMTAGLATVLVLALVPGWPRVSGDEPHYLLVAESLRLDGDLDVADDYAARTAAPWHPEPLSPHYRPGLRPGSRYSMHGVGYAGLLAPILAALAPLGPRAMLWGSRGFQALLYGAFAAALWYLIATLAGRRVATRGTLAATLTAPLLFAPLHLFPEAPAMLLGCLAFVAGHRPRSVARLAIVGVAAAVLPWLGVKYLPMAAVLVAMAAWRSRGLALHRQLVGLGLPVALGWVGHGLFTLTLYGTLSPSAIYLGADPDWTRQPGYGGDWIAYLGDWRGWGRTLAGYVMDQKEGLLPLAPHWLVAAAGLPWLARRRGRDALWLLLVAGAHVGPYALSQQLGGQSPPVRPLMAILWTLAPALGLGLALGGGAAFRAVRGALVGAGVTLTAYLALRPELLPHDYPVDASWLLQDVAARGARLWRWAPSWVSFDEPTWVVTWAWTAAALLAAVALALWVSGSPIRRRRAGWGVAGRVGAGVAVLAVGGGLLAAHATVAVSDRHVGATVLPGVEAWVPASLPERAWAEPGGVWVRPGEAREIVLTSTSVLPPLRLHLRVLTETDVRLEWGGRTFRDRLDPGTGTTLEWPQPGPGYPAGPGRAWRLLLRAAEGASPAAVEGGEDRRQLGAFLRLTPMRSAAAWQGDAGTGRRSGLPAQTDGP